MDWHGNSTEANKTVELALIRVVATVPVTDPTYGGAVVLNPGGPGGSGVSQVQKGGHFIRTILSAGTDADNKTAKHFDIIGFDPRGVNNTRPMLTCFPNYLEAAADIIETEAHGYIGSSDTSFDYLWASKRAMAEGCSKRAAEEGIAKHMSTAPVARDIIEIFERHGQWRDAEARRLVSLDTTLSSAEKESILQRTEYRPGQEMVQYWGFSYGTVLGATLSAMFPDRIKRAVLDGVADAQDYMAGVWSTNLRDTDLIFARLAEYCYEGGQPNCPMWHEDGPAAIAENVKNTIANFRHNPISIPGNFVDGPAVVTYNDLKRLIRDIVYKPLVEFPLTTQVLHELSERNGSTLARWVKQQRPNLGVTLSEDCGKQGPYSPACMYSEGATTFSWDATAGIACSDGPGDRLSQSKEEYYEYARQIIAQSSLIGDNWATIQLPCTAWHARPNWRYEGNFRNKTAHPILFVGNTIDPVTPLFNAFKMAERYRDAGVLHLNGEGHCMYSGISLCGGRAVREYFQSGSLPGKKGGLEDLDDFNGYGALCEVDRKPLDGYRSDGPVPELPEGEKDNHLWNAIIGLNRAWP